MLSQEMSDTVAYLRSVRDAVAPPADAAEALRLTRERAELLPSLYPTPDDVVVREVDAGGVPADLLVPPGASPEAQASTDRLGRFLAG